MIDERKYIDFEISNVWKIRDKFGFIIKLKYSDNEFKRIQKGGFTNRKEAQTQRELTLVELHNGTFIIQDNIIAKDYFSNWLNNIIPSKVRYNTFMSHKNCINNYIIPELGKIKMVDLNRAHIQKLLNKIANKSESVAKICKHTLNKSLDYAVEIQIINVNIAKEVNLPKEIKYNKRGILKIKKDRTLTVEQVKRLIEHSKNKPIYLEVLFAVLMGLRKSEIRGLKYTDIDYINKTIRIERQLGVLPKDSEEIINPGKITKQEIKLKTLSSYRELPIPKFLYEEILKERKIYERNRKRRINDKTNPFQDDQYICSSTYGKPRSRGYEYRYFKEILKEANLPNIRFHDLRATYSTILFENNFSSKAISKIMGHSSEIITIDHYTNDAQIISGFIEDVDPIIKKYISDNVEDEIELSNKEEELNSSLIENINLKIEMLI